MKTKWTANKHEKYFKENKTFLLFQSSSNCVLLPWSLENLVELSAAN